MKKDYNPADEICPVCGYYCTGNGGFGCIDKPALVDLYRNSLPKTKNRKMDEKYYCILCGRENNRLNLCGCPPLDVAIALIDRVSNVLYKRGMEDDLLDDASSALELIKTVVYGAHKNECFEAKSSCFCDVHFGETREETSIFAVYGWFGEYENLTKSLDDLFADMDDAAIKNMAGTSWRCYIEKTYDDGWYMYYHTKINA